MKRILTTTAIVLAMTGTAQAQSGESAFGEVQYQQGDFYASNLIGMRIYNSENEMDAGATIAADGEKDWDDIGEINDIIVTKDGKVSAVVLGVGGFLGVGERDVTVAMDEITVVREEGDSGDRFLVVSTSKEALKAAPAFERAVDGDKSNGDMATSDADKEAAAVENKDNNMEADKTEGDMNGDNANNGDEVNAANDGDSANNGDNANAANNGDNANAANNGDNANNDETAMDGERQLLTRPAVEREGYREADMEAVRQMTSEELEGTKVYGADDESVGEVESLVVGDDGDVRRVVINVGGFLGIGEKPVAVTFDELQILQEENGDDLRIYIDSTEEVLENQPEYEDESL